VIFLQFVPSPPGFNSRQGPLDIYWESTLWPMLRCISEFTLGLVTYRLAQQPVIRRWMGKAPAAYTVTAIILILLAFPDTDALVVMFLPMLLLALALGKNLVSHTMGSPIVFFLGEISYALYLLHSQFLRVRWLGGAKLTPYVGSSTADVLAVAALYASLILCSWLAYRFIEKPGRRWLRKLDPL
jgi:peptidoglycan/LPS O-acetylase OafA/YrhL